MATMINLTIDGKRVKAPEGMNLVDAAELNGLHIPNLCYLKGSRGIGACRLCLVDIKGMKAPMLGCTTKVKEDMIVDSKNEKVVEIRKFVIDLILSMHPLDCMTCTKAGICTLQQYAYDLGIKESSFTRKKFGYAIDEANPFIKRDPDYCVLCGRCARVCKNQGTNVLEFMGRGVGSKVGTADDKPLQESGCTFCGSCVDVCPVNALLEADRWRKGREWEYDRVASVCMLCGNACEVIVSSMDGQLTKIDAGAEEGSVERYTCAYGRFGFDCVGADNRITSPMKRVGGELKETTWQDALGIAAVELKKAGKDAGFITTAGILNEDALTLKKFASEVVKTKNIDSTASLYGDPATLISGGVDIGPADLIVLVDLAPSQWKRILPALDAVIRRKVNSGAKLITVNSSETEISSVASVNLAGNEPDMLKVLAKAIINKGITGNKKLEAAVADVSVSEEADKAATLIAEAKEVVIFTSPAMYNASANLSLLKGTAVSVPLESNAKGVILMGVTTSGKTYREMVSEGMGLLYAIGEVPVKQRPKTDFLVVQNSHMTELAKQADLVLPSAAIHESEGTVLDYLGRMKCANMAIEPAGEAAAHRDIFGHIADAMGVKMKEIKDTEISKLAKAGVKIVFSPFERKEGLDVNAAELIDQMNTSVINGSRLLWLKEACVKAV